MQLLWWCPSESADTPRHQFWEMWASTASRLVLGRSISRTGTHTHRAQWHQCCQPNAKGQFSASGAIAGSQWAQSRGGCCKPASVREHCSREGSNRCTRAESLQRSPVCRVPETLNCFSNHFRPNCFSEHFSLLCQHFLRRYTILD